MRSQTETRIIIFLALLCASCSAASEPDPAEQAPDPIGDELLRTEGTWALPACATSHLYRDDLQLQYQCFDTDSGFSWENRGTLTTAAATALDDAIAAADTTDTTPVNYMGICNAPDSGGTLTMWVGDRNVSFPPFCLTTGTVALYEQVSAIETELAGCEPPLTAFESIEPGCRAY